MSIVLRVYFTEYGEPKTGLSPTVRIRDCSDNSLVVTDAAMTEVGDGWYKYTFASYDYAKDYVARADGGATQTAEERYAPVDMPSAAIAGYIESILNDTNELQADDIPATLATIEGKIDTVDGVVDAILVDTGTTLENHLADIKGATFNSATDSLEAIRDRGDSAWITATGFMPATEDGSSFTAIPWNASWDAEVQSECADALTAYDPPTKAEVDAGFAGLNDPTAADVADAVWDEAIGGHAGAGTTGKALSDVLEDTGTTLPAAISAIEGKVDTVDGVVDAILTDTNELQTDWADGGRLDLLIDGIQSSIDSLNDLSVDSILAGAIEGTLTLKQILAVLLAKAAGDGEGGGTTTLLYKNQAGDTDRITYSVTGEYGNRTTAIDVSDL